MRRLRRPLYALLTPALVATLLLVKLPTPKAAGQVSPFAPPATPTPAALSGQSLPGHVIGALAQATPLARDARAGDEPLTLTLTLNRTDQAGFEAFRQAVENPRSPSFRHFASQSELARRFGPTQQAYDAVLAYVQAHGLTLVRGTANRLTLTVQGTRAQVEQAFNTPLGDYQLNGRTFRANSADPRLPPALAPFVQSVEGLSNFAVPRSNVARTSRALAAVSAAPTPASPVSLATAYNFPAVHVGTGAAATGAGQTIGLVEFDSFVPSDVQSWLSFAGLCAATDATCINGFMGRLTTVPLTGSLSPPGGGETEVLLDIDTLMGMAPGASYRVYESCNSCPASLSYQAMFNQMINDGVMVISNSWSNCEFFEVSQASAASIDSILQAAAASGVSVFNASGDTGSLCLSSDGSVFFTNTITAPADAPHGIAVGGTSLAVGSGNAYQSETWWNNAIGAGGFGVSRFFAAPSYQAGLVGSTRSIPDLVADADPETGILICEADFGGCPQVVNGQQLVQGGTSMAAPEWAAGTALINQALGHVTGNWNVTLYSERTTSGFHPASSMGSDFAHVALGSFNLGNLYAQLAPAPPPTATPVPVPTATATPVPPICTPRPAVAVSVTPSGAGQEQVTIAAQTNAGSPPNRLVALQFGGATNALIDVAGQPAGRTGNFTVTPPAGSQQLTFTIRRAAAGQATTVPLTVQDGCGAWPTFVGGGPSAF